jgi:hypothetical protein
MDRGVEHRVADGELTRVTADVLHRCRERSRQVATAGQGEPIDVHSDRAGAEVRGGEREGAGSGADVEHPVTGLEGGVLGDAARDRCKLASDRARVRAAGQLLLLQPQGEHAEERHGSGP